jgi:hypothetical protein
MNQDEARQRIQQLLRDIPGTVATAVLDTEQRLRAVSLEEQYEHSSTLPVRNVGVKLLAARTGCFCVLKDTRFRPPRIPTVYLVEDRPLGDEPVPDREWISVEGTRYRVVGEEVIPGRDTSTETTIDLEDSFVIFPDRRSGSGIPCVFLLPPIGFPELEAESAALGIRDVISISPSLATDMWLRETFGYSPSNTLATLLVGYTAIS